MRDPRSACRGAHVHAHARTRSTPGDGGGGFDGWRLGVGASDGVIWRLAWAAISQSWAGLDTVLLARQCTEIAIAAKNSLLSMAHSASRCLRPSAALTEAACRRRRCFFFTLHEDEVQVVRIAR